MAHPTEAAAESTSDLPFVARIRYQLDRVVVRVRHVLDLPSRAELVELTRRLEELDKRIVQLAAERVAAMQAAVPALPEPIVEAAPFAEPVVTALPEAAAAAEPEAEVAAEPVAAEPVAAEPVAAEPVAAEPVAATADQAPSPGGAPSKKKHGKNRRR